MTDTITLEFTRVVLAIGVFAIGVELPKAYMARHWKSLFFLLVPVMTWVCLFFLDGTITYPH
jgi:sodium/hydrogen antiporter